MTPIITTEEGQVCVFVAVDHCTSECIGIHASLASNRFEALEPLRQGVREQFGGFDEGIASGLDIRHDHGSAYMSDDFQQELAFLGMTNSPSFVREPEGNGVAERFIRTLKENLLWVQHFATVAKLVEALQEFKRLYNEQWLIERYGYRPPAQVRRDLTTPLPAIA
jgi:transposase InsO family protein